MANRSPQPDNMAAELDLINHQMDAINNGLIGVMDSLERVLPVLDNHSVNETIIDRLRTASGHFASVAGRLTKLGTNLARLAAQLHSDAQP